jgi:hypothetical protein
MALYARRLAVLGTKPVTLADLTMDLGNIEFFFLSC